MSSLISLPIRSNLLGSFYRKLLPRLKVNRNFLVIIVIAPESIGGLGLPSIETQQIVEAIDLILSLYNSLSLVKYLLRESLELL